VAVGNVRHHASQLAKHHVRSGTRPVKESKYYIKAAGANLPLFTIERCSNDT